MSNDKLAQALREIKGCEDYFQVQAIVDKAIAEHEAEKQAGPVAAYTEGHCAEKRKPGGCTLHNLHCGYPACDRKAAPPSESDKEDAENYRWLANNCDGDAQDDFIQMIARNVLSRSEFDAAIRAARAKKEQP